MKECVELCGKWCEAIEDSKENRWRIPGDAAALQLRRKIYTEKSSQLSNKQPNC